MSKKKLIKAKLFTFRNVGLGFIVCLVVAWVILWFVKIGQNITMPQIEYSESWMMYISHLFGSGQWHWGITENAPYLVSFYPPVFYYVMGGITNLFGTSLVVGRIAVLIVFLACLAIIYLIVKELTGSRRWGLLGAFLPLTQPIIFGWSMFVRVDFMALLFELAGVWIVLKYFKKPWVWLSIPLFVLAFYTKQSMIGGILAVVIYIALRNWRFAISYSVMFITITVGILFFATLATGGQFFKEIVSYQQTTPFFRDFAEYRAYMTVAYLEMIPLLALAILYVWRNRKSLIGIYVMLVLVMNVFMMLRPGGAQNYFFEVIIAVSIAATAGLQIAIRELKKGYVYAFGISLLFLVLINQIMVWPGPDYKTNVAKAESLISDATYPILTENAGIVVGADKVPYYEPFVFKQLAYYKYFDESKVLDDLKQNRIEYVITQYTMPNVNSTYRLATEVQNAIAENYTPIMDCSKDTYGFVVYEAKNKIGD